MKILHTVEFYAPSVGGSQEVVRQVSGRLAERGHDVTVATSADSGRRVDVIDGVRVVGFEASGKAAWGMTGDIAGYREYVLGGEWDVMLNYAAQVWPTDALLEDLDRVRAARVLAPVGFSGLRDPQFAGYFERLPQQLRSYDRLLLHSATYQDHEWARAAGLDDIEVIANGADEREFDVSDDERAERRSRFRRAHGIGDEEPLLLTIGTHSGVKGHSLVLGAFARLRVPRATLALVGNRTLGRGCTVHCAVQAPLVRLRSFGRRRALLLDPPRDSVLDAYFAADLFVFGSQVECSPLVLFEAAAAGLPFVTVPAGNAAEIVEWTGGGVTIPARRADDGRWLGDPAEMAHVIESILADPDRRTALGASARAAFRDRLSWERITDRYEQLYRELSLDRASTR